MTPIIAIASSHRRHDVLTDSVARLLPGHRVVRVRSRRELMALAGTETRPEYVFFPHWSWIIPPSIHDRLRCVMFHMTDLPYGRGGSPLQNLIVRGHRDTMLTAFLCEQGLDAGPVFARQRISLAGTAEQVLQRASEVMIGMIVEITKLHPSPTPQEGPVTVFVRRTPADGDLSGLADLERVYDFIRMLDADGYPPAFAELANLRLEFSQARMGDGFVEALVRFSTRSCEPVQ